MSLQNLLAFLLSNWQNVLAWFTQWIGGAINLLSNFWTYLDQKKTEAVQASQQNTNTVVAGAVVGVNLVIDAVKNVLHGRIDKVVVDFLLGIQVAKDTLQAGIELAKAEGNAALTNGLTNVYNFVSGVNDGLKGIIDALGLTLHRRIDQLDFEFRKVISIAGLTLQQKQELLKMFLDDPLGFIASVFFEIALPILFYELARGLSDATVDVGLPPVISSDVNKVKVLSNTQSNPTN